MTSLRRKQPGTRERALQSQFLKLDDAFLDDTRALASAVPLSRPVPTPVLRPEWIASRRELALPKRPRWTYQTSKEELDANEHAYFRTWLAQQDAIVERWRHALNSTVPAAVDRVDSETRPMPHPPTHFERNIEVWRQFWRVTEISQILLLLLDSRCPPLHLPSSLSAYLDVPTADSSQTDPGARSRRSKPKVPRVVLVLTKVDISGPDRTTAWTSFLNANYPAVPVVPVESYAPKSTSQQGHTRYEPRLPGTFRERLVHTLSEVHAQLLQPPQWVTAPRPGETDDEPLQRIARWKPKVKRVIDWEGVLKANGKLVGKAVGGAAVPRAQNVEHETKDRGDVSASDGEEDTYEWKEPEFLTVGVIGQPNVGKSSLLNAIFGKSRVRASRTPGKTKHFQTLFWTPDVRLVDCPGLVMPSFVPMDIQVLSGVLPISHISAVPFCVHQLARLFPLEQILDITHPSISPDTRSTSDRTNVKSKSKSKVAPRDATVEDKRTWRPGQRRPEQTRVQPEAPRWTANDIMTAYANKKGWVTAKAGRPDIHRAGNAILRFVAEGKIPWAFWPPGSLVSSEDGIWLKDGVQQHAWEGVDEGDGTENEMDELSSEKGVVDSIESDSEEEDEKPILERSLGRFGALTVE